MDTSQISISKRKNRASKIMNYQHWAGLLQRKPPLPRSSSVLHKARLWRVSEPSPAPRRGGAVRQSAHRGNSRCAVLGPVTCHPTSPDPHLWGAAAAPASPGHTSQMTIKMDGLTELPEIKSELNPDDFHSSVVSSNPQQQQQQQQQSDTVNNCQQWVSWINPTSWEHQIPSLLKTHCVWRCVAVSLVLIFVWRHGRRPVKRNKQLTKPPPAFLCSSLRTLIQFVQ